MSGRVVEAWRRRVFQAVSMGGALLGAACGTIERDADAGGTEADAAALDAREIPDGAVELPEWHFGRASPLVGLHVNMEEHGSPRLGGDGALYFTAEVGGIGHLYAATSPESPDRFVLPALVSGADLKDYDIRSLGLSSDALEIVVAARMINGKAATTDLFRATRADLASPFSTLVRIDELSTVEVDESDPFLSADGLEIVFGSTRDGPPAIYSARRSAPGGAFALPERIDLGASGGEHSPTLSSDGRRLFFARDTGESEVSAFAAIRSTRNSLDYGEPARLDELNADGFTTDQVVAAPDGPAFFRSNRPWSPADQAIWLAALCEGGPCDEPEVDCAEGVRSPDGRHCYWVDSGAEGFGSAWLDAGVRCGQAGAYLATVHSQAELSLIADVIGKAAPEAWLGGNDLVTECNLLIPGCSFVWATGEPFLFAPWIGGEPNDFNGSEDCLELTGLPGLFNDNTCGLALNAVCERELLGNNAGSSR